MADDIVVAIAGGSATLRTTEASSKHLPNQVVGEMRRTYDGVEHIVAAASVGTLTVPGSATHCTIYAEGAASTDFVRYQHVTNPSATVGKKLKDHEEIASAQPSQFKFFLGSGSGAVTLRVEYYHYV